MGEGAQNAQTLYSYSTLKLTVKILFSDLVPAYFSPFSYKAGPSSDIEVEKRQALFAEKISKKNSFEPSKVPVPSFLQNC